MRYGVFSRVAHVWFPCAAFGHCLPRPVALWREPGFRGRCGVLHHGRSLRGAARGCAGALATRPCLWKWYFVVLQNLQEDETLHRETLENLGRTPSAE